MTIYIFQYNETFGNLGGMRGITNSIAIYVWFVCGRDKDSKLSSSLCAQALRTSPPCTAVWRMKGVAEFKFQALLCSEIIKRLFHELGPPLKSKWFRLMWLQGLKTPYFFFISLSLTARGRRCKRVGCGV